MASETTELNAYEVLGVPRDASEDEIDEAYDRLFDQYEPAAQGGDDSAISMLEGLNEAHATLTDPRRRQALDAQLRSSRARADGSAGSTMKVAPRLTTSGNMRPQSAAQPATRAPYTAAPRRVPADRRPRSVPVPPRRSPLVFVLLGVVVLGLAGALAFLLLSRGGSNGDNNSVAGSLGPTPTPDPSRGTVVASVSGFPIYDQDYQERVERDKQYTLDDPFLSVLIGGSFSTITGTRRLNDIMYEAMDQLINVQVLQLQATREGLYPTPDQQTFILQQTRNAEVPPGQTFQDFLAQNHITEAQYNRHVIENTVVLLMSDRHMPATGDHDARIEAFIEYVCKLRKDYDIKIFKTFEGDTTPCTGGFPQEIPLAEDSTQPPTPEETTGPVGPPPPPATSPTVKKP